MPPVVFSQHIKWNVSIICGQFYLISTTVPKGKEGKEGKSFALLLFVFTFRSIILGDLEPPVFVSNRYLGFFSSSLVKNFNF